MSGMSPAFPGLWDRKDSGILGTLQWDTWDMSRMSPPFPGLWDGKDTHYAVGHSGHVWDVPSIPGTLGWEGQWDFRHSRSGTLGTCLGCPQHSRDSGMGRTLGFSHSAVGHSGHVWDVPSIPGTLGWEGH